MYLAKTAQSTMDFSVMPVDDGVVDSPPNGGKQPNPVSLPSPLKCQLQSMSPEDCGVLNGTTQRKMYTMEAGLPAIDLVHPEGVRPSAKCVQTCATRLHGLKPSSSNLSLPPLPRCSPSSVVKRRECKSHDGQNSLHSVRRPWDAWERRSLKKQLREIVCQKSANNSGYSRGPELLKAMEKLKSRSHV